MPVDSCHSEYSEHSTKWERMRSVLGGEDAIKGGREKYLPKLGGQTETEFLAYVERAQFFNATSRTRDGFTGMIRLKPPTQKIPDSLKPFVEDCDMGGQTFDGYQKQITDEVIGIGRAGTLIDWSENEKRPYVASYTAEQIVNWRVSRFNERAVLALLVLKECVEDKPLVGASRPQEHEAQPIAPDAPINHGAATGGGPQPNQQGADDPFAPKKIEQFRVYRLEFAPGNVTQTEMRGEEAVIVAETQVVCEVHRKSENGMFVIVETTYPKRKGKGLPEIPFVFHGPRDCSECCERPPLEDIALVNLSHYRSSADLEHGRHFTGLPTAWVAGFPATTELKIGSSTAWVSTDVNAKAAFLEFTGQGLGALKEALEQKENQMAVLGARMLEAPKRAAEAAETLKIRASGEGSVLTNISVSLSQSFTQILKWALWWYGTADKKLSEIRDEVSVMLNQDFDTLTLDAPTIVALVKAWQTGAMSLDSLIFVFKQGELMNPDRTIQEEIDLIMTEKLPARALPPAPAKPKP